MKKAVVPPVENIVGMSLLALKYKYPNTPKIQRYIRAVMRSKLICERKIIEISFIRNKK